jgi:hypothetical protein
MWAEMLLVLRKHWPECLMEAAELGMFMVSACVFATILGHPTSPLAEALPHPTLQRLLMGIAMGLTAVGIIYSPWGQQHEPDADVRLGCDGPTLDSIMDLLHSAPIGDACGGGGLRQAEGGACRAMRQAASSQ